MSGGWAEASRRIRRLGLLAAGLTALTAVGGAGSVPSNDSFAAAQVLTGWSGSATGSTVDATKEAGEPSHAWSTGTNSIWYSWTAPQSGAASFTTYGSDFDTVLAVYTGSRVDQLTLVTFSDAPFSDEGSSYSGHPWSRVRFTATAGTTYRIAVDRASSGTPGNVVLTWNPPPPPNDDFAAATALSGFVGSVTGTTLWSTKETGEPESYGNGPANSVWYRWTAPATGEFVFTATTRFSGGLAVYTGSSVGALTLLGSSASVRFRAEQGAEYRIAVDGWIFGEWGDFTLGWTPPRPANDDFAAAEGLSAATGSDAGDSRWATKEAGEPAHAGDAGGASVWYRWSPPASGRVRFTVAADFPTLLGVYTGTQVGGLTALGATTSGSLVVDVEGGTRYNIALDGAGGAAGPYTLTWSAVPPPNDDLAAATAISGTSGSATVGMLGATVEANEPGGDFAYDGPTVWYRWTPSFSGVVTFDTVGSRGSVILRVFRGTSMAGLVGVAAHDAWGPDASASFVFRAGASYAIQVQNDGAVTQLNWNVTSSVAPPIPSNDAFANARTIAGEIGQVEGTTLGASKEAGEPEQRQPGCSVWYRWTAPVDGVVYFTLPFDEGGQWNLEVDVYEGSSLATLEEMQQPALAGRTYYVRVNGYARCNGFVLDWNRDQPSPPNDYFSAAQLIEGESGSIPTTTYNATREEGEPDHACWISCTSVWYRWVAPRDGTWTFDLNLSGMQAPIAVYTGDSIRTLARVAIVYSGPLTFAAEAGVTYSLALVGGPYHATLSWQSVSPVAGIPNDNFDSAQPLAGERGSVSGTNAGATSEADEPPHTGSGSLYSVWYRWTAPTSGAYVFDTAGSSFDTRLAVYAGASLPSLVLHGANDNFGGATSSVVTFGASAGETYSIAVTGRAGQSGALTLNWKPSFTGPANDAFASAAAITGTAGTVGGSNIGATEEAGEPDHAGLPGGASVWYRWTLPESGRYLIEVSSQSFDRHLAVYAGGALGSLTPIASSDDWLWDTSRVLIAGGSGSTYWIAVDGWDDDSSPPAVSTGTFALRWAKRPDNDDFAAPQPITEPTGSLPGTFADGTVEAGEPGMRYYPEGATVWYRLSLPAGVTRVETSGGDVRVYAGSALSTLTPVGTGDYYGRWVTFSAQPAATYYVQVSTEWPSTATFTLSWNQSAPPNDMRAAATELSTPLTNGVWAQPIRTSGSTAGATKEAGEPDHAGHPGGASVWYRWLSTAEQDVTIDTAGSEFDTLLGIYVCTGATGCTLAPVAADDDSGQAGTSRVTFRAAPAQTTYWIAVDGKAGASGALRLTIQPASPPNDHFANAAPIGGTSGVVDVNNNGATEEIGEPRHRTGSGHTVWYRFTAPESGTYEFVAGGDRLAVVLVAYSGVAVTGLEELAGDTGWEYGNAGIRFGATAGQTYMLVLDGDAWGAKTGMIRLTWRHVAGSAGDAFVGAQPLEGWSGRVTGTTYGATREAGEPVLSSGTTVWYRWVAPADGAVLFRVEHPHDGAYVGPVVGMFVGGSLGGLQLVSDAASEIHHVVSGGTTYWVQVDSEYPGNFVLDWRQLDPAANDRFGAAEVVAGDHGAVIGRLLDAARETGEPRHSRYESASVSVWYRWTAPRSGRATIDLRPQWLDDPRSAGFLTVYTGTGLASLQKVTDTSALYGREPAARVRFDAVEGTTYSIAVSIWPGAAALWPSFRLNWALPPANDAFAAAEAISGEAGAVTGRNSGASKELREPDHSGNRGGASVWYRWTAPVSGTVVFDTIGSGIDAMLGVYTGMTVDGLAEVARDDQAGGINDARVVFEAVAGTTYSIALDGFYGPYLLTGYEDTDTGDLVLRWRYGPANDAFAAGETLFDRNGRVAGTNVGATREPGEPAHAGDAGGGSVWYSWTPGAAGYVTVDTSGSSFDTLLAVYTGSSVDALSEVAASDDADGLRTSHVRFRAQAGTTYRIAVDGKAGAQGRLFLNWRLEGAPAHDDAANALPLSGTRGEAWVDNLWATREPGEPQHAGVPGGASVWFRWVSPVSGPVAFETDAYYLDTLLAVYRGSSVDTLLPIASNDDRSPSDRTSLVRFTAQTGVEYLIAADTRNGVYGGFMLYWNRPPPNDSRYSPPGLPRVPGSLTGTNAWATLHPDEQPMAPNATGATVWYIWVAPAAGTVTFDTIGSEFDTLLGVFPTSSSNWTPVATDDNSGGGTASRISLAVQAGQGYHLAVDGVGGAMGTFRLNWTMPLTAPASDAFANAWALTGTSATTPCPCSTLGATREAGEPDHGGVGRTLWARWTAPSSGAVQVRAWRGYYDTGRAVVAVYTGGSVDSLTEVARGESGWRDAYASFLATAGVTYHFALDLTPEYTNGSDPFGDVRMSLAVVTPPANDAFAAAQSISGDSGTVTGDTTNATRERVEPRVGLGRSVWLRWTPTVGGRVTLEPETLTPWSHYDFPRVGIFTGSSLAALTPVATTLAPNPDWTQPNLIRFAVTPGVTYWIQVDGRNSFGDLESGPFRLTWTTLAGDYFDGPKALAGTNGSVSSSTLLATRELGEPSHAGNPGGHSLWFEWTAAYSGPATIDTAGSSFDTILAVYRGSSLGALTPVAASDDAAYGIATSSVTFDAVAGSTYRIAADGYSGASGDLVLNWAGAGPPDTTPPTVALTSPAEGAYVGNEATLAATASDDVGVTEVEFLVRGTSVGVDRDPPYELRWPSWTMTDGAATVVARARDAAGNTATSTRSVTIDNADPTVAITSYPPSPNEGATSTFAFTSNEPGTFECQLDTGAWTACTSPKSYSGLATGSHWFRVRAIDRAGNTSSEASHNWYVVGPPANDAFAAAIELSGASGTVSGSNTNATKETGEPNHAGNSGGRSVWWRWTATAGGTVTITTRGSSFDTLLGVYRGSTVSALTQVAANNNEAKRVTTSRASFTASAGTTYSIAVDGYRGAAGSITLNWTGPVDTTPPDTTITSGPSGTVTSTSASLAFSSNETGSTFACRLDGAAYAACTSPKSYSGLAAGSHTFEVRATDAAGNVDATPASRTWTISTSSSSGPANDMFAAGQTISGSTGTVTGSSVNATRESGEPWHYGSTGGKSIWYRWQAPASGTVTFDTVGSAFDTILAAYTGTSVSALTRLASDDDSAGSLKSRISFAAAAGTVYQIAVDGYGGASGAVALSWSQP